MCNTHTHSFWTLPVDYRCQTIDGADVSGGLCSFGASIEVVKKKVSEMFIFFNLTLHSFGPENIIPLVQFGKFEKGLIEENESYKMVYYTSNMQFLLRKNRLRQKLHELMHQPNIWIFVTLHLIGNCSP
jgi:hypothetical protein